MTTQEIKKTLILVPAPTARGGITNYYQVLRDEFDENIEYFERGARTWPVKDSKIKEAYRIFTDYIAFIKRLKRGDISLVQSTTSLSISTTIRDGLFLKIAQFYGSKTIVFFRGWEDGAERKINSLLWLFRHFFWKTDAMIVLSQRVSDSLKNWGYQKPIYIETTLFDKKIVEGVQVSSIADKYIYNNNNRVVKLLYLSRVERRKGVFDLLDAFSLLKNSHWEHKIDFSLNICGDGLALEEAKKHAASLDLSDVKYSGFIAGDDKIKAFKEAHMFVFPSYSEGMPNAVLEAMGFGLPVISTPVGGLVDFFKNEEHGLVFPIADVNQMYECIKKLSLDFERLQKIATDNFMYASEHFRSDEVAKRINKIFKDIRGIT